mmetsp:Transcript_69598/g.166986  ORF Transcript_69598/g.166986 Transcript_69598/m.166986 type:complete len:151 (-) Transcript_69598:127-579(-)
MGPERSDRSGVETPTSSGSGVKISGSQLESWFRRRAFELRVGLAASFGSSEVLEVLKSLQDSSLVPPFTEVKMWLGLDEQEALPESVETLVTEFRAIRSGQAALPPAEASMGQANKDVPKARRPSGQSPKAAWAPPAKAGRGATAWQAPS